MHARTHAHTQTHTHTHARTHAHTHTHTLTHSLTHSLTQEWLSVTLSIRMNITVVLNCLHRFSESMPHILRTLHTNPKNIHNGQNPSFLLQNETSHSKQCYFFSKWDFVFKWHTQTIICIDIYKNQLNTDVLNVKHYDECKTLLLHSS